MESSLYSAGRHYGVSTSSQSIEASHCENNSATLSIGPKFRHETSRRADEQIQTQPFSSEPSISKSQLLAYCFADKIICPTDFQASTFPPTLQQLIRVVHEGIDVDAAAPRPSVYLRLSNSKVLSSSKPIITYVSRTLEPQRGFHVLMRTLPEVLDACPTAEVVIVGEADRDGYGGRRPDQKSWKRALLDELGNRLDLSRVHFIGTIDHTSLIDVLSISSAHVYYTYPFVLSWSVLEAMACECLVIASDTAPVRDAISNGVEGLLLPFFDVTLLSQTLIEVIERSHRFDKIRKRARERIALDFSRKEGSARWMSEIDELLGRGARAGPEARARAHRQSKLGKDKP